MSPVSVEFECGEAAVVRSGGPAVPLMSTSPLVVTTGPGWMLISRDAISGLPACSLAVSRRYERAICLRTSRAKPDCRWPARTSNL
jgi:hypothetical protein